MKILFLISSLIISVAAQACPFCNSKTAKEMRVSLFGPDLPVNLFITILPFIIFSLIVYFIYYGGFPAKKSRNTTKSI